MRKISQLLYHKAAVIGGCLALMLLCSCTTTPRWNTETNHQPVRNVDFHEVPEMKEYAERVRQIGNEMYPKICALLGDDKSKFLPQFDIVFKKWPQPRIDDVLDTTAAYTPFERFLPGTPTIVMLSGELEKHPADLEMILVHEMTHVAQNYLQTVVPKILYRKPKVPDWWVDGMAHYTCFKSGLTSATFGCPECAIFYPHYRDSYSCAAAFLLFAETKYDTNLVRKLHFAARRNLSTDEVFVKATGKSVPKLWAEFQKTPAFTPEAARALALDQLLGYLDGKAPKDIAARFKLFMDQHAEMIPKELVRGFHLTEEIKSHEDILTRKLVYLYLTQPGRAPETFFYNLHADGKIPGLKKGEMIDMRLLIPHRDLNKTTFPFSRTLECRKKGDSATYHYTMLRASAEGDWKLAGAWRTDEGGQIVEEYLEQWP